MINVAIVDDNQINRKTIKDKLSPYKDINLMFEATNGEEFFEKLKFLKKEKDIIEIGDVQKNTGWA